MSDYLDIYHSPIGSIVIGASDRGISFVSFVKEGQEIPKDFLPNNHTLSAIEWLDAFFAGQNLPENIEYDLKGTDFQKSVWDFINEIPLGKTITYNDIAKKIPGSHARAVGTATGANPVGIMIPCHRVMGSDGKLHGYAGGIKRKIWLLAFEQGDSLFLPDV